LPNLDLPSRPPDPSDSKEGTNDEETTQDVPSLHPQRSWTHPRNQPTSPRRRPASAPSRTCQGRPLRDRRSAIAARPL